MDDYIEIKAENKGMASTRSSSADQPQQNIEKRKKIRFGRIFFIIILILALFVGVYYDETVSYANQFMESTGLTGLTSVDNVDDDVVATIGDRVITMQELDEEYEKLPEVAKAFTPKSYILNNMINRNLLLQVVDDMKISVSDEEINTKMDEIKKSNNLDDEAFEKALIETGQTLEQFKEDIIEIISIDKYLEENVFMNVDILDEDVKDYYNENLDQFKVGEKVEVSHILISSEERSEEKALAIIQAIKQRTDKDDFDDLVEEYSEDSGKETNKGFYSFGRNEMVPEFEQAAFSMTKVGEISEPVKTTYGYHLIKFLGKTEGKVLSFEETEEEIIEIVENEEKTTLVESLIEELKDNANVVVNYEDEEQ